MVVRWCVGSFCWLFLFLTVVGGCALKFHRNVGLGCRVFLAGLILLYLGILGPHVFRACIAIFGHFRPTNVQRALPFQLCLGFPIDSIFFWILLPFSP